MEDTPPPSTTRSAITPSASSSAAAGHAAPPAKNRTNASSIGCVCFSFCTLADASRSLRLIPDRLPSNSSPWVGYLRGVYGPRWTAPPANERVHELAELQLLYAHGLPIARCTLPAHPRHTTVPELPVRIDALCAAGHARCDGWHARTPVTSRPPLRNLEPYFQRSASGQIENLAFRWWWRAAATRSFVPSFAWVEVYRWARKMEGEMKYGFWCATRPARRALIASHLVACQHAHHHLVSSPERSSHLTVSHRMSRCSPHRYVPAKGSGIYLNVGATLSHPDKTNASHTLCDPTAHTAHALSTACVHSSHRGVCTGCAAGTSATSVK
jgi:hypothetical protein